MERTNDRTRNELTPEQKLKAQPDTKQDVEEMELSVDELEERIAPRRSM
jgi:uncharacterized small protein (DUF1192 family)